MKPKLLLLSLFALALVIGLNAQTDPGTDNITHQWTFEDGGTTDPVGGIVGTLTGGATVEDGMLVLDAADEFLELNGMLIGISAYTELSVAIWWRTLPDEAINTGFHMIWYFGGSEVDGIGGTADLGSNGVFLSPARGDDVARTAISCGNIETPWTTETGVNRTPEIASGDSLYHAVTTINDSYLAFYLNGELIDTANLTGDNSLANLKDDFAWIGRGGYGDDPNYWCKVDELTIYNKMLSEDEVAFLAVPPASLPDANRQDAISLKVYASDGFIHIDNVDHLNINSIEIYDMAGRIMYQTDGFQEVIDANLPSGLYIIRAGSDQGSITKKIAVR